MLNNVYIEHQINKSAHRYTCMSTYIHLFSILPKYLMVKFWVFFKITLRDLNYRGFCPKRLHRWTRRIKPMKFVLLLRQQTSFLRHIRGGDGSLLSMRPRSTALRITQPSEPNSWLPNLNRICSWSNCLFTGFMISFLCASCVIILRLLQTITRSQRAKSMYSFEIHKEIKLH